MEAAEKVVNSKIKKLNFRMRSYTNVHLTAGTVDYHKSEMDEIKAIYVDLLMGVDDMCEEHKNELQLAGRLDRWKNHIPTIERDFSDYTLRFAPILDQLKNSAGTATPVNSFQEEQLKLMREKNDISKRNVEAAANETLREIDLKKTVVTKKAKAKMESIMTDVEALGEEVNKIDDWKEEVDLEISKAMRNFPIWKRKLEDIVKMRRELIELVAENDISDNDVEMATTEVMVDNLVSEVKRAIEEITEEDKNRELYTLDAAKVDKIKLPVYEGRDDEDYMRFKELIEKAFVHNRVSKSDRVAKLRDCLRGHAKRLVPESITNVDVAWDTLEKAFGDPDRLMRHRKAALDKLGTLPRENAKGGFKGRVEWYLELEGLLQSLVDIGDKDDEMYMEAFNKTMLKKVCSMFPSNLGTKLTRCEGKGRIKLQNMMKNISDYRLAAQEWVSVREAHPLPGGSGDGSRDGGHDGGRDGGRYSGRGDGGYGGKSWNKNALKPQANPTLIKIPTLLVYNPPRRDEKCRVCTTLETKGDNHQLYDNHINSFPTGCPRYMAMSVDQRLEVALAAHLCFRCHDPEYIHKKPDGIKKPDPNHKCIIKGNKKSRYTCTDPSCTFHMWICTRHKQQNLPSLKKFQEDIRTKFNLDFGFVVSCPIISPSSLEVIACEVNNCREQQANAKKKPKGLKPIITKPQLVKALDEVFTANKGDGVPDDEVVDMQDSVDANEVDLHSATACNHQKLKSLSTDQALDKMKRKLTEEGVNEELRPIAKGRAQFMIGNSQGRTRSLLNLYDTGCSGVLFRDGVPQNELSASVLKTKGPYIVNGVGDTKVKVNDEYMCTMSLVDGTRQVFEGWTVDKITAPLPYVNLAEAETLIKSSLKNNNELQNLKCQPVVGGECDVLIGIMHNSIFPEAVHSLDSGLTIYKLKITSHDKKYNAVIGGPHESFQFMAQEFGGMGIVFANLCQQLEAYKKFGPPKIHKSLMTSEEMKFAKEYKEWEIENFEEVIDEFKSLPENKLDEVFLPSIPVDTYGIEQITVDVKTITCSDCGDELSIEAASTFDAENVESVLNARNEDDEEINALRKLQKAQSEGLNIEYRCPKCRSCSDCRRSLETERVSLREEAEDQMIWDSVTIDWKNKRIICYLPLRGKPEDFLSNNREIALKVLDQQCYKYSKDIETRDVIIKAFEKLMKNGQMVLLEDLTVDEKKVVDSQGLAHYIVWRVVFKLSLSTPARPVFDGSQNTKPREDGTAGRCLNDAVVKGRVVTLNLVRMVLRFCIGKYALQGDLKQFYASIKLVLEQWNLQRVLYRKNLDPKEPVQEAVIKTLIWGIKSVSAQSECAIIKLAEAVKDEFPLLADFLINSRFVDDLGHSEASKETVDKLVAEADNLFSQVGLACKGWSISGSSPPVDVCEEGETVSIGGNKWHTKLDLIEVPLPPLHFSRKIRGRLQVGTEVFRGSFADLEKFVPKKLTRRILVSKVASVFDLYGKFTPAMTSLKVDLREAVKQTSGWDDSVSPELRSRWLKNFWKLEKLRGIKFERQRMPSNAVSTNMDLIVAVDAANHVKVVGAWGRFRLDTGDFSCSQIIGRSLLADEDSTIPKNELDALTMGSNLSWIVRQALDKWINSYILIGDSTISMCWVTSEKKRLGLYHRNRANQIRRGVDTDKLFHVVTACNPADLGTRPDAVKDEHVGPNSIWEKGLPWMNREIDDAVTEGILTPASSLRMNEKEEESYNEGLVFERSQEILTRGHPASILTTRVDNVKMRSEYSRYPLSPTKFSFEKTVRIYAIIMNYIKSHKCLKNKIEKNSEPRFQMFLAHLTNDVDVERRAEVDVNSGEKLVDTKKISCMHSSVCVPKPPNFDACIGFGTKKVGTQFRGKYHINLTEDDMSKSLNFLFRKGSEEVKKFCKPEFLKKITVDKNGILMSKSRILDGQRFQTAGGLEDNEILKDFGLKLMTPVLDRFSPLSYSIGDYIHRKISKHGGYETCLRDSLSHCFIIQGMSLFRELGDDCVRCAKKRKKYLDISMGPISDMQLTIAPPFWITLCDIYGPCQIYVPGHSMKTRKRDATEVKCYVLVFVCPTTKMVNLQVIESKSADGVVDGVNRLGCEQGFPSFVLVDQDSGILKALNEAEVNLKDVQLLLHKEKSIQFKTCPVSGHNFHGAVERRIRTVQECLVEADIANLRLHATGLQTVLKLIENDINNLPLGYAYGRDSDNSPVMKLIFPNMLKIGRLNTRALDGPVRMSKGPGELMKKIEKGYSTFFKIWNTTMVPKLMKQSKWFDSKSELLVGDIVYFRKVEGELSSRWTVGKVVDTIKSKDGMVRRAEVQYQNSNENSPRTTDRAARSLIKLFNVDDQTWQEDMAEVEKLLEAVVDKDRVKVVQEVPAYVINHTGEGLRYRLTAVGGYADVVALGREEGVQHRPAAQVARAKLRKPCELCCCNSHCVLTDHGSGCVAPDVPDYVDIQQVIYADMLDRSWLNFESYEAELEDCLEHGDPFMSLLCAVNTDLDADVDLQHPGFDKLMV